MAASFRYIESQAPSKTLPRQVLVTGAAGRIGSSFAEYAHEQYPLTLLVHHAESAERVEQYGKVVVDDLGDLPGLCRLFSGMDTILHLAADASPHAQWESLLANNIVGTHNVFKAAVEAGCRRVVFASSIHAVSGYPVGCQVHSTQPVNPGDLYGVSKCFGEALARMTAEQESVSSIVLRIGAFQPREKAREADSVGMLDAFISHRDLNQLICCSIDDKTLQFALVHALSNNRFNRMDITTARQLLGYEPQDDFTRLNHKLRTLNLRDKVRPHNASENKATALTGEGEDA